MGGFVGAWVVAEGLLTYRWIKQKAPPPPGVYLKTTALYVALALIGEAQQARPVVTALAWAWNLAVLVQVAGGGAAAQVTGWPPPAINDPTVFLPSGTAGSPPPTGPVGGLGAAAAAAGQQAAAAAESQASGGGGASAPKAQLWQRRSGRSPRR